MANDVEDAEGLWHKGLYSDSLAKIEPYVRGIVRKLGFKTNVIGEDDLTQLCLIKLFKVYGSYDGSQGSRFKSWVYMVISNYLWTHNRRIMLKTKEHKEESLLYTSLEDYYSGGQYFGEGAAESIAVNPWDVAALDDYATGEPYSLIGMRLEIKHFANWLRTDGLKTPGLCKHHKIIMRLMADWIEGPDFEIGSSVVGSLQAYSGRSWARCKEMLNIVIPAYQRTIN